MTEHEKLQARIPELAMGRLSGEERRALEDHLARCPECSGVLEVARDIGGLSSHPEVAELRRYALERPTSGWTAVEAHVATCASCALELAAWQRRRVRTARWAYWAASLTAAGLLLWFALDALERRGGVRGVPVSTNAQIVMFSVGLRSTGVTRVIEIDPTRDVVAQAGWEPLEPFAEVGPLGFEIVRLAGPSVWSRTLPGDVVTATLADGKPLSAVVPPGQLTPGAYEFRLKRLSRPAEPPLIQDRFEVRAPPSTPVP